MRRIAFVLIGLAVVGLYWACSADAPTPTPPRGHPGGPTPLQVVLFTGDANPTAGTCTLIQAIVTLNGVAVPDGTGVSFSTDFGVFSQNGQPVISVTTQKGTAVTALCSNLTGTGFVNATASASGSTAKAEPLKIVFQPSAQAVPFFSSCSPSFASAAGGTTLVINGGRFPGDASTTRAQFTAQGITREAPVVSVTPSAVTVLTPAFPEVTSTSVPVQITLTFNSNSSPLTLSVPNCFAFGTVGPTTPNITAILPSSGGNSGNTRVSIIGTGFSAPVQVFFGTVEATVVSVSFSQIVVLSPPAFGAGAGNLNATVNIRVHEVNSGTDANFNNGFRFTPAVQIISFEGPNIQRIDLPFSPLTIHGQGFEAPVKVGLAGVVATVLSVSATEILVLPGTPLISGCGADVTGSMTVTNIDTGDSATGQSFTYAVAATAPRIDAVTPPTGDFAGGFTVDIFGAQLTGVTSVKFGTQSATGIVVLSDGHIQVTVPSSSVVAPPACPAGVLPGTALQVQTVDVVVSKPISGITTCSATAAQAFTYTHGCV